MHARNFGSGEWCTVQERVHKNGQPVKERGQQFKQIPRQGGNGQLGLGLVP
jgi:hypothetical protein